MPQLRHKPPNPRTRASLSACVPAGWPKQAYSSGGILVAKNSKSNIPDTQTAVFDYGDVEVVWIHRTWGDPPDPKYTWAMTFYGDKGTLKASVFSYDFIPKGGGQPVHRDVTCELEEYPEDKTEKISKSIARPPSATT